MSEETVVTASRTDVDNIVFSAATEISETLPGMSVRERTKFAIAAADRIMEGIDSLGGAAKRSEAAKKAAAARYAKPKPTPGPAIPQPQPEAAQQPAPPIPAHLQGILPQPPHPSLAPGAAPFGAPPQ